VKYLSAEQEDAILTEYENNWNKFSRDALGVRLDRKQRKILESIQLSRRVSVRSGHAAGKDYVAAVASLCFLYHYVPSKVINTAPTDRQVISIMMSEIGRIYRNANINLGGDLWTHKITFPKDLDWFLLGFKTKDKKPEDWTGFHSPNLMVVITEASGIDQATFDAIEGILTGNSRLVLIFNPNRTTGEAYQSTRSPQYEKFKLNCLNAVNVRAKKILIPGQVDYEWIDEKIKKPGWVVEIEENEVRKDTRDFKWEGKWYRPNDLFLVKVMGEFPRAAEDTLIPLSWVEMANDRWREQKGKEKGALKLGVDVAGMGRDLTVFAFRRGNIIEKLKVYSKQDHMVTVGRAKNELIKKEDITYIDSAGEGAGVFSRLIELKVNAVGVKASESAKGLTDLTEQRTFANMRAYLYWALRDALDPAFDEKLALPPVDELTQDLTEVHWSTRSNGDIIIEEKDKIKKRLGRSPDYGDAVANTCSGKKKHKQAEAFF